MKDSGVKRGFYKLQLPNCINGILFVQDSEAKNF